MLITIRDATNPDIYFSLYNPDVVTYEQMLTSKFNLFVAGTPSSAPPRDLLFLDPPYDKSTTTPYMGWARITSSGYLVQYLGAQDTDGDPLVNLQGFKTTVQQRRTTDTGDGTVNRSKAIGPDITWELQP